MAVKLSPEEVQGRLNLERISGLGGGSFADGWVSDRPMAVLTNGSVVWWLWKRVQYKSRRGRQPRQCPLRDRSRATRVNSWLKVRPIRQPERSG